MNEVSSNFERVRELCSKMTFGSSQFFRADMDELVLRTSVEEHRFPKRFLDLVSEADIRFVRMDNDDFNELGNRLKRILKLDEEIGLRRDSANEDEELLPTFSLNEDDRAQVLKLCEEMRRIVFASNFFDHAHKRRLSNRISAIERQVHQSKGLFDVILGGLSDVGEALGKFGNDVKPLTDRMAEIAKITRDRSKEYESLPAPEEQKRLPPPDEE